MNIRCRPDSERSSCPAVHPRDIARPALPMNEQEALGNLSPPPLVDMLAQAAPAAVMISTRIFERSIVPAI